jgi:hypothetical protein
MTASTLRLEPHRRLEITSTAKERRSSSAQKLAVK